MYKEATNCEKRKSKSVWQDPLTREVLLHLKYYVSHSSGHNVSSKWAGVRLFTQFFNKRICFTQITFLSSKVEKLKFTNMHLSTKVIRFSNSIGCFTTKFLFHSSATHPHSNPQLWQFMIVAFWCAPLRSICLFFLRCQQSRSLTRISQCVAKSRPMSGRGAPRPTKYFHLSDALVDENYGISNGALRRWEF